MSSDIEALVLEQPFCEGLEPAHAAFLAGQATEHCIPAGQYFFREGEPAHLFYIITEGSVALEIRAPHREPYTTETLHDGDVLGWSWLVPPHRWAMGARAVDDSCVLRFNAAPLRAEMARDPAFAAALYRRFLPVLADRLFASRLQLLDLYDSPQGHWTRQESAHS